MRPSRTATKLATDPFSIAVWEITELTVARAFLTRWSSSATRTRWRSSARLRSVTSMLTPTTRSGRPSSSYEIEPRLSIQRTSPVGRTMRYSAVSSFDRLAKDWSRDPSYRNAGGRPNNRYALANPEDNPDPCRQEIDNTHHDEQPDRTQPRLARAVEAERGPLVLLVIFP